METTEILIIILASVGVVLGFFFAFSLLAVHNKMPKAKIFLALFLISYSLRFAKSIVLYYNPMEIQTKNLLLGTLLAVGPALFFYTKQMLNNLVTPKRKEILIYFAPFILFELYCVLVPDLNISYLFYILMNIHIAGFAAYSLFNSSRNTDMASIKTVRWLYALNIVTLLVVTFSLLRGPVIPLPYIAMTVIYSFAILFLAFWAIKNLDLFKNQLPKYSKSSIDNDDIREYMSTLKQVMDEDKLYLDSNLNLSKLSTRVGISSKKMSQVINQSTQQNYSKYIAGLRINEAQRLLKEEHTRNLKIAAIAYDSGFNSLSSFNTAFNQLTGMTASEFRNQYK